MSSAPAPSLDLANIPIDKITESPLNHRTHFAEVPLRELAESIRKVGLLQPVIGRQLTKQSWELVIGARRLRASKLAGLKEIPMRVGVYTDAQVLEIQLIENLQREDVHALEEAAGFKQLLSMPGYDLQTLADKLGHKTPSYISKRLSLLKLVKPARVMFEVGEIDLSHAMRIARLRPEDQELLLKEDGALFESEREHLEGEGWITVKRLRPVASLEAWINQKLLLKLSTASWALDNASLVAKAGACTACPKRTGANLALFDDVTEDRCLDVACFTGKREAQVVFAIAAAPAGVKLLRLTELSWMSEADKKKFKPDLVSHQFSVMDKRKCGHLEPGIFITGPRMGETVEVCRNSQCGVRFPHQRPEPPPPKNTLEVLNAAWDAKEQLLKGQIDRMASRAAMAEIVKKTKAIGSRELRWGVRDVLEFGGVGESEYWVAGISEPADDVDLAVFTGKLDDTKLVKLWVACLLANNRETFEEAVKAHRVDMKKLTAEVGGPLRAQFKKDRAAALAKAKDAPKPAAKKTAAKKAKGRK